MDLVEKIASLRQNLICYRSNEERAYQIYKNDELYILEDVYIPVTKDEKQNIEIKYKLYDNKSYSDNDKVGVAEIYIKDSLIDEVNIYVLKESKKENLSWWDKLLRWLKW